MACKTKALPTRKHVYPGGRRELYHIIEARGHAVDIRGMPALPDQPANAKNIDFIFDFGGEGEIRTRDTHRVYRFSRPAPSTARPMASVPT